MGRSRRSNIQRSWSKKTKHTWDISLQNPDFQWHPIGEECHVLGIFRPQEFIVPLEEVAGAVGPFPHANKQRLVGGKQRTWDGEKVCINGYGHPQVWSWYILISDVYWNMEQSWQKVCLWSFNSVISQQTNWDDWDDSLDTSGPRISRKEILQIPGWPWYWMITAAAIISGRVFMAEITGHATWSESAESLDTWISAGPEISSPILWSFQHLRFPRTWVNSEGIHIAITKNRNNLKASDMWLMGHG